MPNYKQKSSVYRPMYLANSYRQTNNIGKDIIPTNEIAFCDAPEDKASNEISLAVSNPKPNRKPSGKTCQL